VARTPAPSHPPPPLFARHGSGAAAMRRRRQRCLIEGDATSPKESNDNGRTIVKNSRVRAPESRSLFARERERESEKQDEDAGFVGTTNLHCLPALLKQSRSHQVYALSAVKLLT